MKQELFKTLSQALLLACLMCTATSMSAEKVLIDGLYYTLSGNFGGATVEKPDSGMYVGDIDIPAEVTYIDVTGSYASNEIAINWNASLVSLLGWIDAEMKSPTD